MEKNKKHEYWKAYWTRAIRWIATVFIIFNIIAIAVITRNFAYKEIPSEKIQENWILLWVMVGLTAFWIIIACVSFFVFKQQWDEELLNWGNNEQEDFDN